jgi:uncharacterized protein
MLIISDTSPITNLWKIGELDLLHQVFDTIVLPKIVYDELSVIEEQKLEIDGK